MPAQPTNPWPLVYFKRHTNWDQECKCSGLAKASFLPPLLPPPPNLLARVSGDGVSQRWSVGVVSSLGQNTMAMIKDAAIREITSSPSNQEWQGLIPSCLSFEIFYFLPLFPRLSTCSFLSLPVPSPLHLPPSPSTCVLPSPVVPSPFPLFPPLSPYSLPPPPPILTLLHASITSFFGLFFSW